METPSERFNRIVLENNLSIVFLRPNVKYIENGGVIVEQPQLQVSWLRPPKVDESSAKKVARKTPEQNG